MSNITIINSVPDNWSESEPESEPDNWSDNGSDNGSDNESDTGSTIKMSSLAAKLRRIKAEQFYSIYFASHPIFLHSVLKITYSEMAHLASHSFITYLLSSDPVLAEFVKKIMFSIYKCNENGAAWYVYSDYDTRSHSSIFVDNDEHEECSSYDLRPPYVENIGSLHLIYFYPRWLKYYTIGTRLPLLMLNAIVSKKQKQQLEIKQICKSKGLFTSFKDALCSNGGTKASLNDATKIQLFFKLPKELGICKIAAFLGDNFEF